MSGPLRLKGSSMKPAILLVAACVAAISFNVSAARQWEILDNQIKSVKVYNHVISGTGYNVIQFVFVKPISTGCAYSDATNSVSFWDDSALSNTLSTWVSVAMAAQAQKLPVDVYTDPAVCSTNFGRQLRGIAYTAE